MLRVTARAKVNSFPLNQRVMMLFWLTIAKRIIVDIFILYYILRSINQANNIPNIASDAVLEIGDKRE